MTVDDPAGHGPPASGNEHQRRRLYGRKLGRKLRPAQAVRLETLMPRLAVHLPPSTERLAWPTLFAQPVKSLWVEIGFGAGEHLAWQAAHNHHVGLIGCEPFIQGMAQLLRLIEMGRLDNIRLFPDDGRRLIDALPDASVGRCFVLFPDPWPKRRHWARRFIAPATLDALARVMADDAELRLASDHPAMIDWMLAHTRRHPAFSWTAERADDWRQRPPDWPVTRYEAKALHGRPAFLQFLRRRRSSPEPG